MVLKLILASSCSGKYNSKISKLQSKFKLKDNDGIADIIDNCPSLKIIGRGGVGMDNIDVDYAKD